MIDKEKHVEIAPDGITEIISCTMPLSLFEIIFNSLDAEAREHIRVNEIKVKGIDYSVDHKWRSLKSTADTAYAKLRNYEYEFRTGNKRI